jgi:hypothetical protein
MASPEREWHERRLARPVKEGAFALLLVLLDSWVGLPPFAYLLVFLYLPLAGTSNVMGRFRSPSSRDWWLGTGGITRSGLARHVLVELLACSALHAVALALVRPRHGVAFERLGLSAELGFLPTLGLLFLLQLSARSALACGRHVGTCTWVPSALRATANGFRGGPAWTWALLQHGVVTALLAAPIVLGAVLARPGWFWFPTALLYPALLAGMIASSEAIQTRLTASAHVSDFLRWSRLLPARSARFAPRVGLLWTGSKPSVRVLAGLVVLGSVLSLAFQGSSATWLPTVELSTILLISFLVAIAGVDSPFLWRSEGSKAAYLHAAGIDHVLQRRAELLSGALLAVAWFAFVAWLRRLEESMGGAAVMLPLGSQLLLRSVRAPVLGASTGRELAPVLFVASNMLLGIVFGISRGFGVDWEGLGSGAVALGTILALQTAVLTLGPLFLWWGAWRSTRDEGALKASIHG